MAARESTLSISLTTAELRAQAGCLLSDLSWSLSEYIYREKEARKLMSDGGRTLLGRDGVVG
jgi:hypothetical protein